jgi:hypothetical protein
VLVGEVVESVSVEVVKSAKKPAGVTIEMF